MPTELEIDAAARAMREMREHLIAQPLSRVWPQIARAALDAAERARGDDGAPPMARTLGQMAQSSDA